MKDKKGYINKAYGAKLADTDEKILKVSNRRLVFLTALFVVMVMSGFYSFVHWSVGFTSSVSFCIQCHEMAAAYRDWQTSSHNDNGIGVVADCTDCHLPPGFVPKITVKIYYGIKDSYAHYFGTDGNLDRKKLAEMARRNISDDSCLKCHKNLYPSTLPRGGFIAHSAVDRGEKRKCISCHNSHNNFVHNYKLYFG